MATICPTVLATEAHQYREQMERIESFSKRIQIDLADGVFAPTATVNVSQVWWPKGVTADLHLMYKNPAAELEQLISLKPHMVIIHAEADGQFEPFAASLHKAGIKVGVALLPDTPESILKDSWKHIDHVLIFSGDLGHFGGNAHTALLAKAQACKAEKPSVEIGWDGGVNDTNIHLLAAGGIDVLNVGGYIQKASDPADAYATLKAKL
jgi:ribulose-phosphate 3-epimerase